MTEREKELFRLFDVDGVIKLNSQEILMYRRAYRIDGDDNVAKILDGACIYPAREFPSLEIGKWYRPKEDDSNDQ